MLEIHPSARKHGIADEGIEHAMAIDDTHGDGRSMSDRPGMRHLLEVQTLPARGGHELAIHAMRMRPKYRHLLLMH